MSYVVVTRSGNNRFLLGGVKEIQSSRFGDYQDAVDFMEATIDTNSYAAPVGEIQESIYYPEIFRHCPEAMAQALGGKCSRCGTKLTVGLARVWHDEHTREAPALKLYGVECMKCGHPTTTDHPRRKVLCMECQEAAR